jgi:two-component system, OmpR family, response regulator
VDEHHRYRVGHRLVLVDGLEVEPVSSLSVAGLDRRALVVEDDEDIRALLSELLRQSGFEVTEVADGTSAVAAVRDDSPDLVTLDLNLPDMDGIEVCRRIRQDTDAYVIMLTARPDEIDRLVGLETGADDYMTKPFSPRELKARVAAMMRRPRATVAVGAGSANGTGSEHANGSAGGSGNGSANGAVGGSATFHIDEHEMLRHGELEVDVDARTVILDGRELDLTRTEFDLLTVLLRGPRRVWARDTLLRLVWGSEWAGDGHLVEVHMGNLRRKLGDDARSGRLIRTVRGVGYRMGTG